MKIKNIVDYLASKAVVDNEGYYAINETVYLVNDNYTYYYYSTFEEAMVCYSTLLEVLMGRVVVGEMITSGMLRLGRVIHEHYYEKCLTASDINENLTFDDTTLYEFKYTASKREC